MRKILVSSIMLSVSILVFNLNVLSTEQKRCESSAYTEEKVSTEITSPPEKEPAILIINAVDDSGELLEVVEKGWNLKEGDSIGFSYPKIKGYKQIDLIIENEYLGILDLDPISPNELTIQKGWNVASIIYTKDNGIEPESSETASSSIESESSETVSSSIESESSETVSSSIESESSETVSSSIESESSETASSIIELESNETISSYIESVSSEMNVRDKEIEDNKVIINTSDIEGNESRIVKLLPETNERKSNLLRYTGLVIISVLGFIFYFKKF